ncbi:MAG: hypothetical protein HGA46_04490 [Chlorobiaceae bacterium]|nr:hypothetical protein [Chlorobiaceae bacterium]
MSSSTQEWYLRIEAVNLDHSVYDTNDISTIRGGSSLLLNAVYKLTEFIGKLEKVSVGASTGLYKINAQDSEIQGIEQSIRKFLQSEHYAHFATFVVATAGKEPQESLANLNKRLITECAWQQYQMPSFSFPAPCDTYEDCGFGGVRPGIFGIPGKEKKASQSVYTRRDAGKDLRKKLYEQSFDGIPPDFQFTDDLEELAQGGDIALIHFDGNRFGNIRDHCFFEEDFRKFDCQVQGIHKKAIRQIVEQTPKTGNRTRLETLLWGGDEIELVVPASAAWKTLKLFFDSAEAASFQTAARNSFNLTYSAGVVFCRHNLPILQIRRYADQLCSIAKQQLSGEPEKFSSHDNRFAYLNMSSFDLVARDVDSFIDSYHQPALLEDFTFNLDRLGPIHNAMLTITRSFPRNKIYEIVEKLQHGLPVDEEVNRALDMVDSSARSGLEEARQVILDNRDERWLLIGDLWNLIGTQAL